MKEIAITLGMIFGVILVYVVIAPALSKCSETPAAPAPDTETAAAIQELHAYQAEVEKYRANCNDLEKIAKDCAATLRECVDTLQSNYLLPKPKEP